MLRDENLVPLSHQHQHALALCVRIERAALDADAAAGFNAEIGDLWNNELRFHFEAEETVLFPAAEGIEGLRELVEALIAEHENLREWVAGAREKPLDSEGLREFGRVLAGHVRKEERQLFEGLQKQLTAEKLNDIGEQISVVLARAAGESCALKTPRQG